MKKSANREQRQRTYLTDNSYIWDGYGELSRQRHQIRRGRRRGAGPAAGKGAGHPHAGRYALPLSVPLHRPYEDLPHRPDRGRGFRTHPVPGAHHRRQLCRSGAQTTFHGPYKKISFSPCASSAFPTTAAAWPNWSGSRESNGSKNGSKWGANT